MLTTEISLIYTQNKKGRRIHNVVLAPNFEVVDQITEWRSPEDVSVAEMIAALEGPIGLTECTVHPGACSQESSCHVREPWQRINQVVRDALARITLADLAMPGAGTIVPLASLGVDTSTPSEH